MNELLDILKNYFTLIFDFVLKALLSWWNMITKALSVAGGFLIERLSDILPESQCGLASGIIDYFECLNYYFPVKEMFVILIIYLQFRIALLVVRISVKVMTAGQF